MEHDFPKSQFACHFIKLLGVAETHQTFQSTTMLRNECTHTFLYVFGHYRKYMLGLLLILISKSWGGFSYTFVC